MEYLLTAEELEKLEGRKKELEKEEVEIVSKIERFARENEGYSDTFAYERLRRRLAYEIPEEKQRLCEKIANAKVISDLDVNFDGKTVCVGVKVTLNYDGEEEIFSILPVSESSFEKGIVSCNAPIVEHIIGRKKGDVVMFNGITVEIIEIEKA